MKYNSRKNDSLSSISRMIDRSIPFSHPFYDNPCATDTYYASVAKKVLPMLFDIRKEFDLPDVSIARLAMCIALYFEDVVSELGLWSAFIARHRELYGHWLPWYDTTEDYYEDEVNPQDIKFVIWMFMVSTDPEAEVTSPEHPVIEECAQRIFDFLVDEFEVAPANEELVNQFYREDITDDFYSLKKIFVWMAQTCYLMTVPSWQAELRGSIRTALKKYLGQLSDDDVIQFVDASYSTMRMRMGPLALYSKEWLVEMRRRKGIDKDNDKILEIESTPFYPFIVVSNNGKTVSLRSIRDVQYKVETDSFTGDLGKRLKKGDIIATVLVQYKGVWRMNGIAYPVPMQPGTNNEQFMQELARKLMKNGAAIDLFDRPDRSVKPMTSPAMVNRLKDAITANNGKPLFYFPSVEACMKFEEEMFGNAFSPQQQDDFLETYEGDKMMCYVDSNYSLLGMARAETIKDPDNPSYDPKRAYLGGEWLYNKFEVPDQFSAFLVKNNFLAHLNFNLDKENEHNAKLIAENLPFFASFMRQYPCL